MISEALARELGYSEHEVHELGLAATLHDIGKISVPDVILNKPSAHTPEETVIMRTHAERGAYMLAQSRLPLIRLASEIAATLSAARERFAFEASVN